MNKLPFAPKGRRGIPDELIRFGRHLVYSEGTRTEPNYVKNIRARIGAKYACEPNKIDIIPVTEDETRNTVGLVNYAIDDVQRRLANGEKIDHVWMMFDKDDFPHFEEAHQKIEKLNNSKTLNVERLHYNTKNNIVWHSCWSNESFELWLCLYFCYYQSASKRTEYIHYLKNNGIAYKKNLPNIHDILVEKGGSLENAIKYAKKLEETNGIDNPSTGMYKFAEYFIGYMKK